MCCASSSLREAVLAEAWGCSASPRCARILHQQLRSPRGGRPPEPACLTHGTAVKRGPGRAGGQWAPRARVRGQQEGEGTAAGNADSAIDGRGWTPVLTPQPGVLVLISREEITVPPSREAELCGCTAFNDERAGLGAPPPRCLRRLLCGGCSRGGVCIRSPSRARSAGR